MSVLSIYVYLLTFKLISHFLGQKFFGIKPYVQRMYY